MLRKNVALCRMAVQYAEPGTEVEVGKLDGHQKRIPATVVRVPFYDPDKTRPPVRGACQALASGRAADDD